VANFQTQLLPYDGEQNSTRNPLLLDPKDVVLAENVIYTDDSTKRLRPGLKKAFESKPWGNTKIISQIQYHTFDKGWRLVCYDGLKIFSLDENLNYDVLQSSIDIPLNTNVVFEVFFGVLCIFFGDKITYPLKWTMTGAMTQLHSTAPVCTLGRVFQNRLWVDDVSVPGRVLYTGVNSLDFSSGGEVDCDPFDGDPDGIRAIHPPLFGSFYVSKRLSTYKIAFQFDGTDIFYYSVKLSNSIGCVSHSASVASEGAIFFPSDKGIHVLDQSDKISGIETQFLSDPIRKNYINTVNFERSEYMRGFWDTELNSYVLLFPSVGSEYSNEAFGFSAKAGKWYYWPLFNHTSACTFIDSNDSKKRKTLLATNNGNFGFFDFTINSDYGVRNRFRIVSSILLPTGNVKGYQVLEYITLVCQNIIDGKIKLTSLIDGRFSEEIFFDMTDKVPAKISESFKIGSSAIGGITPYMHNTQKAKGSGRSFQFVLDWEPDQSLDETAVPEILGVILDFESQNSRRETRGG
jgi:hypothetical protein